MIVILFGFGMKISGAYTKSVCFIFATMVATSGVWHKVLASDSLSEAYQHYQKGNNQKAINILSTAVQGKHQSNPTAHYYLGSAWMKEGKTAKARYHYKQCLDLNPSEPLSSYCKKALGIDGTRQATSSIQSTPASSSGHGVVGIAIDQDHKIVKVVDGGPAQEAGLEVGDKIISVDGKSIYNLSVKLVSKTIMAGPPASKVKIGVDRKGKQLEMVVIRGDSSPQTVAKKLKEQTKKTVKKAPVVLSASDKKLVEIHQNKKTKNTDYVYDQVATALNGLSDKTKDVLRAGGCKILLTPTILSARPDLRGVQPSGYLHGGGYDNCPGMFDPSTKVLYIAESASRGNSPPQLNEWAYMTTLHELGHAFDFCKNKVSDSTAFQKVVKEDHHKLTNTTREAYWYYTQPGRGESELFAETFATIHGQGLDPREANMSRVFPNTTKFIKAILDDVKKPSASSSKTKTK